jgi:flagellar hook-associated protein 2
MYIFRTGMEGNGMIIGTVSSVQKDATAVSSVSRLTRLTPILYSPFNLTGERESFGDGMRSASERTLRQAATGIAEFLQSAQAVQSSATALLHKDSSSIQARTADSSDTVKITAKASNGATLANYRVQVEAAATSQVNSGITMGASGANAIQAGSNQLKIAIGGRTTTVTSRQSASDTNEQALTKLSSAINAAKTGVNASVVTDKKAGTVKLELTSTKTGSDQMFSVSDAVGNAVAASGITNTTSIAMNASYRVNGGATQVSQSNEVTLERGKVVASLRNPSIGTVEIQVKPDGDQAVKQVKQLVESYNGMRDRLNAASGYINRSVAQSLDRAVSSISYEQIGIEKKSDGSLMLDEDKLRRSLFEHYDQTSRALTGSRGLASSVSQATERFNDVSASTLINNKLQAVQQFAVYQSSMQTSLQLPKSGLLLNQFV